MRWKTISIRGMLLLVLSIALWLGWIVNKARQQREAVAALQKFGGFVHYDWEFALGLAKVPRGNLIWMPSWGKSGLKRLRILEVDHSKMTDASLAAIGKMTNLAFADF